MIYRFFHVLFFLSFSFSQTNLDKILNEQFNDITENNKNSFALSVASFYGKNENSIGYTEISPKFHIDINNRLSIYFKQNIIRNNSFYTPIDVSKKFYQYKDFSGFNSYTEEGYLNYSSKIMNFKVGRFYDQLGTAKYSNLFIGNHDYHDGYKFSFNYKKMQFNTRFYQLANYRTFHKYNRYFYQHSLTWNVTDKLSIEFIETATTASENGSPKIHYMNPLTVYYAIQTNHNINSNTMMGFVSKYKAKNSIYWLEFLIDDFQVDDKTESGEKEKEPTEFGIILGSEFKFTDFNVLFNFSVVRNRTYNDEVELVNYLSFTKYIDHNKIIGYENGNNLVEGEIQFLYILSEVLKTSVFIEYGVYGPENVFAEFDKSFYERETTGETIPFGVIEHKLKVSETLKYKTTYGNYYLNLSYDIEPIRNFSFWLGVNLNWVIDG